MLGPTHTPECSCIRLGGLAKTHFLSQVLLLVQDAALDLCFSTFLKTCVVLISKKLSAFLC